MEMAVLAQDCLRSHVGGSTVTRQWFESELHIANSMGVLGCLMTSVDTNDAVSTKRGRGQLPKFSGNLQMAEVSGSMAASKFGEHN